MNSLNEALDINIVPYTIQSLHTVKSYGKWISECGQGQDHCALEQCVPTLRGTALVSHAAKCLGEVFSLPRRIFTLIGRPF